MLSTNGRSWWKLIARWASITTTVAGILTIVAYLYVWIWWNVYTDHQIATLADAYDVISRSVIWGASLIAVVVIVIGYIWEKRHQSSITSSTAASDSP